jgi:putative peptidoglycan lipid II flippase
VVQFSSYVDRAYATLITERAVAALTNAQLIALLPVSLFGMAISAAELPALSEEAATGREARVAALRERLLLGLERIAFFVVPSAVAFLLVGDLVAMPLLQSGRFTAADTRLTWYILIGASVGLLAQTQGRLYSSAFYALNDTRTPLKIATLRVLVGAVVGYGAVRLLPTALGLPAELGVAFITGTSGLVAWLEYALLRRALAREVGDVGLSPARVLVLLGCAGAAGASALGFKLALTWRFGADAAATAEWGGGALAAPALPPMAVGLSGLLVFALVYGGLTLAARVPQATSVWRRIRRQG